MLKITYTARFQKHYKTLTDAEKKLFRSKAVQIRDTMKTVFWAASSGGETKKDHIYWDYSVDVVFFVQAKIQI